MPAGRPPKTDSEKRAKGTYKPSRSTGEAKVYKVVDKKKIGRPRKVKSFDGVVSDEARKLYNNVLFYMQENNLENEMDTHLVALAISEYDTYIQMKNEKKIEYNDSGLSVVHASVKIRNAAIANFLKIFNALGLTPLLRERRRVKEDQSDDPMQALFMK
jgi:phage terminase small subunit